MAKERCEEHSGCVTEISNLKESDKLQWAAISKLQNRLPVWATLFISFLTFALGASVTYAKFAIEIARIK